MVELTCVSGAFVRFFLTRSLLANAHDVRFGDELHHDKKLRVVPAICRRKTQQLISFTRRSLGIPLPIMGGIPDDKCVRSSTCGGRQVWHGTERVMFQKQLRNVVSVRGAPDISCAKSSGKMPLVHTTHSDGGSASSSSTMQNLIRVDPKLRSAFTKSAAKSVFLCYI